MIRHLLFIFAFLLVWVTCTPLLADDADKNISSTEISEEDMEVVKVMEILTMMDLAENLDLLEDMDLLTEEEDNENNN